MLVGTERYFGIHHKVAPDTRARNEGAPSRWAEELDNQIKSDQIQRKQIRRKVTRAPKENRPTENKKEVCFKEIGRRSTEAR